MSKGVFRNFAQYEFVDQNWLEFSGFNDYGYVYYPNRCYDGSVEKCHIHVEMHGCGCGN